MFEARYPMNEILSACPDCGSRPEKIILSAPATHGSMGAWSGDGNAFSKAGDSKKQEVWFNLPVLLLSSSLDNVNVSRTEPRSVLALVEAIQPILSGQSYRCIEFSSRDSAIQQRILVCTITGVILVH